MKCQQRFQRAFKQISYNAKSKCRNRITTCLLVETFAGHFYQYQYAVIKWSAAPGDKELVHLSYRVNICKPFGLCDFVSCLWADREAGIQMNTFKWQIGYFYLSSNKVTWQTQGLKLCLHVAKCIKCAVHIKQRRSDLIKCLDLILPKLLEQMKVQ